jgi:hypothetical protein
VPRAQLKTLTQMARFASWPHAGMVLAQPAVVVVHVPLISLQTVSAGYCCSATPSQL